MSNVLTAQVKYSDEGLASLIFTAEGDMRQAVNNLQSTWSGFGFVSPEGVFKVCDQPHPVTINAMVVSCTKGDIDNALDKLSELWTQGYSAVDIVTTLFKVVKNSTQLEEFLKLEFASRRPIDRADVADQRDRLRAYAGARGRGDADAARRVARATVSDASQARALRPAASIARPVRPAP